MQAKILSLNIGDPAPMEWQGKTVLSSMKKTSVPGPLVVHADRIEGNTFASPNFHGTPDSVLYAFGLTSAAVFLRELGVEGPYEPGLTGETITLDQLDEAEVSAGDIFRFGGVMAQATYPRIPCGKVNFRMRHAEGQRAMQRCGRSGVYFRILSPGEVRPGDVAERIERSDHPISILDLYGKIVTGEKFSSAEMLRARANGSIPERILAKLG